MMLVSNKKLIVIGGPTASGKTSLAIKIAQHFNTEILSADSRQCYKELNIGVAKPSAEELEMVKHHFINSHSIHEEVTAGDYERYGLKVLEKIFATNNYAVLVGGTGLYIKAVCEGLDDMPRINKNIKQEVESNYEKNGLAWLQQEVKNNDPNFLQKTDGNNPMRLLRALIFFKSHKESILDFQQQANHKRNFDIEYYAIDIAREKLYERIELRVDEMMQKGLLNEVKSLENFKNIKALQTVGYKELFSHLEGEWSLAKAVDKIKQHTRNYAKRQVTWFNNQGEYIQLPVLDILRKFDLQTNCST